MSKDKALISRNKLAELVRKNMEQTKYNNDYFRANKPSVKYLRGMIAGDADLLHFCKSGNK